jgi:hypothetical protein
MHVRCKSCRGKVKLALTPALESKHSTEALTTTGVESPTRWTTCPSCASPLGEGAVICVKCGYGTRFVPTRPIESPEPLEVDDQPTGRYARLSGAVQDWLVAAVGVGLALLAVWHLPLDLTLSQALNGRIRPEQLDVEGMSRAVVHTGTAIAAALAAIAFACFLLDWLAPFRNQRRATELAPRLFVGAAILAPGGILAASSLLGQQWGLLPVVLSWGFVACLILAWSQFVPVDEDRPDAMAPRPGTRRRGLYVSVAAAIVGMASAGTGDLVLAPSLEQVGLLHPEQPGSIPVFFALNCSDFLLAGVIASALARRAKLAHALGAGYLTTVALALRTRFFQVTGNPGWTSSLAQGGLYLPLAFLGGLLDVALTRVSRRLSPRQSGAYLTIDGRSIDTYPPWRDLTLARVWFGLALVMLIAVVAKLVTCWAPVAFVLGQEPQPILVAVIASGVCITDAAVFYVLGRRRSAPAAVDVLRRDPSPPVVYLRSFRDDGRRLEEGILHELGNALKSIIGRTVEQRLAAILRKVGPVVAIGRPGEDLPEEGAARMYVAECDWRDVVLDLLSRARMVILQVGDTAGLRWEIVTVGQSMRPEQVLLFAAFDRRRDRRVARRADYYQRIRDAIEGCLPTELPDWIGDASLIYFTATPPDAPRRRWVPHVLEPGVSAFLGHPLSRVLDRFARSKALRRPRNIRELTTALIAILATVLRVLIMVVTIALFAQPGGTRWPYYVALATLGSLEIALIWVVRAAGAGRLD